MSPERQLLFNNLRQMRVTRGISQLELALRLGVSQRHVSFVEVGRSGPSRNLVMNWASETGASIDERNAALISAGFAPVIEEADSGNIRGPAAFTALSDMIVAHDPYPGIVFDADWKICAMNEGAKWLCSLVMPEYLSGIEGVASELDMIDVAAHPDGWVSRARNGADAGFALLDQLRAEQLTRPALGERVDRLEESLWSRFGARAAPGPRGPGEPYLNLTIDTEIGPLSFLLVQTIFGLPQNVTVTALRSELWFPVDEISRSIMENHSRLQPQRIGEANPLRLENASPRRQTSAEFSSSGGRSSNAALEGCPDALRPGPSAAELPTVF